MNGENTLTKIYEKRFSGYEKYRNKVWKILVSEFFNKWIKKNDHILDLGCGYGEFINQVDCKFKNAMDLNPKVKDFLEENIVFHEQDCSKQWCIEPESLDLVFTSNFFEHLPDKNSLNITIKEIKKVLKPGGLIIAMGPNISVLDGNYWDFWDHHIALSDKSLLELFKIHNFKIVSCFNKFLPYNMIRVRKRPLFLVSLYLKIPFLWNIFGKQFLLIAQK